MGRAGRERALELFSWRAVAGATAAAYERVITAHRSEQNGEKEQHADR
jgi:hypothetical protein